MRGLSSHAIAIRDEVTVVLSAVPALNRSGRSWVRVESDRLEVFCYLCPTVVFCYGDLRELLMSGSVKRAV